PFKSVDDLAKVPGIKEATINKFRAQATVGNGTAAAPKPAAPAKPQPATK
ncbi:MAG: topoisomerase, partial [Kingella sp. (in: b-proteobacteria)]